MATHAPTVLAVPVSERDHTRGPATAPVTLLECGDYECPYCGRAYPVVEAIRKQLGDRLRFVFRHFPLVQMHPHALHAAEAAEAAGAQGKFWPMHGTLFTHQQALDDHHLVKYAASLGLDVAAFRRALEEDAYAGQVREDVAGGLASGVAGTPTFFVNDVRYEGSWDYDTFLAVLVSVAEASDR